ncbi:hypothetical protein [Rhodocyclus tenuis]|uniref:hypothetical protein n=1 Tax=Rhodocyclus tenuis TaxID=1066 RepID=UPI001906812E|nr:hypothetical protein [Rhodocyclus tenuis]MBK1679822.1 hypothetical protein [Rhodocyclus tenuis]
MSSLLHSPARRPEEHPLLQALLVRHGYPSLTPESLPDFLALPGESVLFFVEDPQRFGETLDLAVILPELVAASPRPLRAGVLMPAAARALAPRYGIQRWPALVFVRGNDYLGALEGTHDWSEYLRLMPQLLAAAGTPAPVVGVPLTRLTSAAGAAS